MEITVNAESTPNPQTMKFVINTNISPDTRTYEEAGEAYSSPLAQKLFGFPWTQSVHIGSDFVSLTKQEWVDWTVLEEPLCGLIKEHVESGEPSVLEQSENNDEESENDSEEVKLIKKVLNKDIRPQVALDGGDIVFNRYEDNVVYIHMRGACAGCPSSTQTLKMGIETRLMQALPEIKEVVSI
ncbi:MAG: NifU family protein [Bdellovibrionales bacterium]